MNRTNNGLNLPKMTIGLTGSMGSGKSTLRRILSGVMPVTDADAINARLLEKGNAGWRALKEAGLLYAGPDGSVDKEAMAQAMFTDPVYRKKAQDLLHPLILQEMMRWMAEQPGICAAEVPLLFELGLQENFDQVWTVVCRDETALDRLERGRSIPRAEARRRLACQYPAEKKAALSDVVFHNDGTREELARQVNCRLENLQASVNE